MSDPATLRAGQRNILVMLPTWLGDTVMATPTLRLLRTALPGARIVAFGASGVSLLAGLSSVDETDSSPSQALLRPLKWGDHLRPRRFDAALMLPNSWASAIAAAWARVPIRVGYERDGRQVLLTHALATPRGSDRRYAIVPAVDAYLALGRFLLASLGVAVPELKPALELATIPEQEEVANDVLARGGIGPEDRFALLNPCVTMRPGKPSKRWPVDRFPALAAHLITRHGLKIVLNGPPAERELVQSIADGIAAINPTHRERVASLPELQMPFASFKAIVRRAAVMVTNDTGPRHVAAAFGVPCVTLFGPTDHRWTTLPDEGSGREAILLADPTLPAGELANDHPDRCRIERITLADVVAATDRVLGR